MIAPAAGGLGLPAFDQHDDLRDALRTGQRQLALVEALAVALDFGDLDLPTPGVAPEDQAQLRLAAPLYFAAALESANLLPALELVAALWASGGVVADFGDTGPLLMRFARERESRLTADERKALFGRIFGIPDGPGYTPSAGRNLSFEPALAAAAAAMVAAHGWAGAEVMAPAGVGRLRSAALQVLASIDGRMGGIASFAATEVLEQLRLAIAVFKMPQVQRALGATSLWNAVRAVQMRYGNGAVDVVSHVTRARTGQAVLSWLADVLPDLIAGRNVPVDETIAAQALQWIDASRLPAATGVSGPPAFWS